MKVGDLVRYNYPDPKSEHYVHHPVDKTGIVLYNNKKRGTLKVRTLAGRADWFATCYCEILNESR